MYVDTSKLKAIQCIVSFPGQSGNVVSQKEKCTSVDTPTTATQMVVIGELSAIIKLNFIVLWNC